MSVAPKGKTTPREMVANAWRALESTMGGAGISWSDIGNWIEQGGSDAYTEDELQQFGQARHAEGVEAGIKIGEARGSNGGGNGCITVPKPSEIAKFCHQRLSRMKDDAQRNFVRDSYETIRRGGHLPPGPLGYLVSIYMKHGGDFQR
jgi:hypothetical protein